MKSIFNQEKEVTVEGKRYKVEADVTIEGTEFFRVTSMQTGEDETVVRKGNKAKVNSGLSSVSDETASVLESIEEIEII